MKLFSKFMAVALVMGMTACQSNDDEPGGIDKPGNDGNPQPFYSTISFTMQGGSRSAEENEGEEIGQDVENKVGSILVVMATKDADGYKYLTCALNDAPISGGVNGVHKIVFQDREVLYEQAGNTVHIFAYCNPTTALRAKIAGTLDATTGKYAGGLQIGDPFTDLVCNDTETPVDVTTTWLNNGFLMTNVEIRDITLPEKTVLQTYNTPENAFPLGKVPVMRTAARFDFRDATEADCTYSIKDFNDNTKEIGKVQLTRAALFNVRDEFYYLPRVHAKGVADLTLCPGQLGMEFGNGVDGFTPVFVVSPTAHNYSFVNPDAIDPLNPSAAGLEWKTMAEILGGNKDNPNSWDSSNADRKDYHIWRYTTENTFDEGVNPTEKQATGIVFEARIIVADDFGNVVDGKHQTMYLYDNYLYPNALAIAATIKDNPNTTLASAYEAAFDLTRDSDGNVTAATEKEGVNIANLGFTAYRPNAANDYLCYYFYYNRHVDDDKDYEMGDMEFATVRNNVYKIAVKNIKRFGGFSATEPDKWDTYFEVECEVMNWVVRVNDGIEF